MTTVRDVGDRIRLATTIYDDAGNPTAVTGGGASMSLTLLLPDATTVDKTSSVSFGTATMEYSCLVDLTMAGTWRYKWTATGDFQGVDEGEVIARSDPFDPGSADAQLASYALTTLAAARAYCAAGDANDPLLATMINAASLMMIQEAGREFAPLNTGTPTFPVRDGIAWFAPRELQAGTATSTVTMDPGLSTQRVATVGTEYRLLPEGGRNDGGGYNGIRFIAAQPSSVTVAGTWGWSAVPGDVEMLCRVQVKQWWDRDFQARSNVVAADTSGDPGFVPALGLSSGVKRALVSLYGLPVMP